MTIVPEAFVIGAAAGHQCNESQRDLVAARRAAVDESDLS